MSSPLSSFLSGLAYLAFCLLIAASRASRPRDGGRGADYKPPGERSAGSDGPLRASSSLSCPISLSLFLFMPCGALPSLFPVPFGALIVVVGLMAALGFLGGWGGIRRQGGVPLCLGGSLAAIAWYARERGIPGDLYVLDAYVAMPVFGVAEGVEKLGLSILAVASLLVLWRALPVRRVPASGEKLLSGGEALLAALAAELWRLAAIAFWVCLFFPASFALAEAPGIAVLGGLALNALFFWAKVLVVEWLLGKLQGKYPRGAPFHVSILFAFLGFGAWLLLGVAAAG